MEIIFQYSIMKLKCYYGRLYWKLIPWKQSEREEIVEEKLSDIHSTITTTTTAAATAPTAICYYQIASHIESIIVQIERRQTDRRSSLILKYFAKLWLCEI